jgi:predicted metal-dependent enzyme (double-stranded beta helix superfamily)
MEYDFEHLKTDVRSALKRGNSRADIENVRQSLAKLLTNQTFIGQTCGESAESGLHLLYEDPELGFQVLAHINEKARRSPPHDHGESWAVYGQALGYTDMKEWQRCDDGADPDHAKLEATRAYRLNPGEVGVYSHGAIHAIDYPDKSRFIRITGTNLDKIWRIAISEETGQIRRMGPQRAS